jgi:hypothetical protein
LIVVLMLKMFFGPKSHGVFSLHGATTIPLCLKLTWTAGYGAVPTLMTCLLPFRLAILPITLIRALPLPSLVPLVLLLGAWVVSTFLIGVLLKERDLPHRTLLRCNVGMVVAERVVIQSPHMA